MRPSLEGYAAAIVSRLAPTALGRAVGELASLNETIHRSEDLDALLSDTSLSSGVRSAIIGDLLEGKVGDEVQRIARYNARVSEAVDVVGSFDELALFAYEYQEHGEFEFEVLGLSGARERLTGFADALLEEIPTDDFASIEDDLFHWARAVSDDDDLRRLLTDRDAPLVTRLGVTDQLLAGRVAPVALMLARYAVLGGRPRDIVGSLDYLVVYVAESRGWRVARVHSALSLDDADRMALERSIAALTGRSVEVKVVDDPDLLSGVLVHVGDLRLDASTKGRLRSLHDAIASPGSLASLRASL